LVQVLFSAAKARGAACDPRHLPFIEGRLQLRGAGHPAVCGRFSVSAAWRPPVIVRWETRVGVSCSEDRRSSRMRPGKTQSGYAAEPPQAPRPTTSNLPSIGFYSAKTGSPREPLGAKAQTGHLTGPMQQVHASGTCLSFGGFSTSRAGEAELGQQRRVLQRRLSPLFPCLAF